MVLEPEIKVYSNLIRAVAERAFFWAEKIKQKMKKNDLIDMREPKLIFFSPFFSILRYLDTMYSITMTTLAFPGNGPSRWLDCAHACQR